MSEDKIRYSSAPIMQWSSGDFEFQNGILDLTEEGEKAFNKVLDGIPMRHKNTIKRIGFVSEVEAAQQMVALQPQAVQGGSHTGTVQDNDRQIQELQEKLAIAEGKIRMAEINQKQQTESKTHEDVGTAAERPDENAAKLAGLGKKLAPTNTK